VDYAVGGRGTCPQDVEVGETAAQRLGAGRVNGLRGGLGAGKGEDGVAPGEQLGHDGRADQAGATGDEDAHGSSWSSDGTSVPSR
jgi:hypothetical protein